MNTMTDSMKTMTDTKLSLVMSRREVATALGLSVETIDRMRDRGQIRSVVIGGSVRIPVTEIDRLVAGRPSALRHPVDDVLGAEHNEGDEGVSEPSTTKATKAGVRKATKAGVRKEVVPIGVRLPVELVERVQNYRAGLELPGMEFTLTDAIRVLLEAGLRAPDSIPDSAKNPKKLSAHVVREIAVRSQTDPRTVQRFIAGALVRLMAAERIAAAMRELGLGGAEHNECDEGRSADDEEGSAAPA